MSLMLDLPPWIWKDVTRLSKHPGFHEGNLLEREGAASCTGWILKKKKYMLSLCHAMMLCRMPGRGQENSRRPCSMECDVRTVRWWLVHLGSGDSGAKGKPYSELLCQLSYQKMKSITISSSTWIIRLQPGKCAHCWILASVRWTQWWQCWLLLITLEIA